MSIGLEILKGQETSLIGHSLSNGKLYFCTDTGNVFLDTNNENENDVSRLQINANRAYYLKSKNETLYIDENFISLGRKDDETPGDYSIAVGLTTSARGESSAAFGQETLAIGKNSLTVGYKSEAHGECSFASGYETAAIGQFSHAEGLRTIASGDASHAEGVTTTASEQSSHAEGNSTIASGLYSHAEGSQSEASGKSSHAEGTFTIGQGDFSHAEGFASEAFGEASHAEGVETKASGNYSHAEGIQTTAGAIAHAEGCGTTASGDCSHAQGYYTIAEGESQTTLGKYNIADITSALIIGNGTADDARSNAYQIDWDGNSAQTGSLQIGSYLILGDESYGYDLPETGVENQLFFQAVAGNELTTGNYEEYLPLDFIIHDTIAPNQSVNEIQVPSKLQVFDLEDFSLYADGLLLTQGLYYYFDTNY